MRKFCEVLENILFGVVVFWPMLGWLGMWLYIWLWRVPMSPVPDASAVGAFFVTGAAALLLQVIHFVLFGVFPPVIILEAIVIISAV